MNNFFISESVVLGSGKTTRNDDHNGLMEHSEKSQELIINVPPQVDKTHNGLMEHSEKSQELIINVPSQVDKKPVLIGSQKLSNFSLIGILKSLLKKHKIHKVVFKESIRRIKDKRNLSNSVKMAIFYYQISHKASRNKSTMTKRALSSFMAHKRQYLPVTIDGLNYSPIIRRLKFRAYMGLYSNKFLSSEYKEIDSKRIYRATMTETKRRLME